MWLMKYTLILFPPDAHFSLKSFFFPEIYKPWVDKKTPTNNYS